MAAKLRNVRDLVNKPEEPDFKLKIEPTSRLVFQGDKIDSGNTAIQVLIENITEERQAYKIKCTSTELFRVRPPIGVLEPKEITTVTVAFSAGKSGVPECFKHFFAFYHVKAGESKNIKQLWSTTKKPDGVKRMWCIFLKMDGSEFTPPILTDQKPADPDKNTKENNNKETKENNNNTAKKE
uniref:Major sperm protein n=1 Tax=Parastrongyloides trichosuri TaxID=131310 RepID=A0A0N4Z908_PARTI